MEELAKDKWREGWVKIQPRHSGSLLKGGGDTLMYTLTNGDKTVNIPYFTIAYGYRGSDIVKSEVTDEGEEAISKLYRDFTQFELTPWGMSDKDLETKEQALIKIHTRPVVKGFKIVIYIDGVECMFFEDEVVFLSNEEVAEYLVGNDDENTEAFIPVIQQQSILQNKDFKDRLFYLSSRSVPKHIAIRYLHQLTKDSVYYIPFPQLLEMFFREDLTKYKKLFNQKVELI